MIISAILVCLGAGASAQAQSFITPNNSQVVTPKFVPAGQRTKSGTVQATYVLPTSYQQPDKNGLPDRRMGSNDESADLVVRTELPGPQRLFTRESESQFYERVRQEVKKQVGANPPIFPEQTAITKERYSQPAYPRVDPLLKLPFPQMVEMVEPSYVCHRRLLFEQPNFERVGHNFGMAQPIVQLGVFYYDVAMLPYHYCSDLRNRGECNVGKCLPGDPAPLTVPIERFSVTGIIGQAGAVIGGFYLFPH